ncbi:hypothetical protein NEMIN01_0253 [Nematocida minor]|uniref:uncharacterized protein n=1 Tax=Nematocida minor TaxID=1912983 RepID=UPI002220EF79|nr:uncharacterized protein NEMIN01_0253 [Nematocida minor]KAI5188989.1 hypothetical protein NEMIN01_0253 [Nematocida minor]
MAQIELRIKAREIVEKCLSINAPDSKIRIRFDSPREQIALLNHILRGNLEIESKHTDEEKQKILGTLMNDLYQYLAYDEHKVEIIRNVQVALRIKDNDRTKTETIRLINELIEPNPSIYNPEHGMHRKKERVDCIDPESASPDLSTRRCVLEIDDRPSVLENMLQATTESLERHNLFYISGFLNEMGMHRLKEYAYIEKYYTLDGLYTKKYEGTETALVDYGLNLVFEKFYEIAETFGKIRNIEPTASHELRQRITEKEITKLFTPLELSILASISENASIILYEKRMQNNMFKTLEYVLNNTKLLEEKNGAKALNIGPDLSRFYEDYITSTDLIRVITEKRVELAKETREKTQKLEQKTPKHNGKEARIHKRAFKNSRLSAQPRRISEDYAVKAIKDDIKLLEWKSGKEVLQIENIHTILSEVDQLSKLRMSQKEYMVEKIKEFEKLMKVKAVAQAVENQAEETAEVPEEVSVEEEELLEKADDGPKELDVSEGIRQNEIVGELEVQKRNNVETIEEEKKVPKERNHTPTKLTQGNIIKMLIFGAVCIAASVLLVRFLKSHAKSSGVSY